MSEITKRDIAAFYDRLSPHFRELWGPHLHDGFYATGRESKEEAQDALVRYLAREAGVPIGARVLDVGCGMGATAVSLALDLGCDVTGITLSAVQVEIAQALAEEKGVAGSVRFEVMDADQAEFPEPFDAVWMVGVLGHLPDQAAFVRRSTRLLRPGGRFVLGDWMVPSDLDPEVRERLVEPVRQGMLMPTIRSLDETTRWFAEAGYRVLASRDLTAETLPTWDHGVSILKAKALWDLARELGRDALDLLAAIRGMKQAMAQRAIVYGAILAELPA
jgi:tocopherol O-methyltransferase